MPPTYSSQLNSSNDHHRSLPAGNCLISELTQSLLESPKNLPKTLVVLPTQRLRLYLTRELLVRSKKDALLLPKILTWDNFLESVVLTKQLQSLVMVSSQLELVMESAIMASASKLTSRRLHANKAHAHELLYFYLDLRKSDTYVEGQDHLKQKIDSFWHYSPAALSIMHERIDDVFSIFDEFDAVLMDKNWTTKPQERRDQIRDYVEKLPEDLNLDAHTQLGVPRVIVAGLTSLSKIEQNLLKTLSRFKGLEVWLDEPPPRLKKAPITNLREAVGLPPGHTNPEVWAKNVCSITEAKHLTHEAVHALNHAYELIASGCGAHEVAIIVPDEKMYGPVFAATKDFFEAKASELLNRQITVNLPLAAPWSTSTVGSWLRLAKDVAQATSVASVGQYLLHPLTIRKFSPKKDEFGRLQKFLKDLPVTNNRLGRETIVFIEKNFSKEFSDYIQAAWSWCLSQGEYACDNASEFAEQLESLCELEEPHEFQKNQREREAWKVFRQAIHRTRELDVVLKYTDRDWPKFVADVYRLAEAEVLRDTGEPLSGLQILGLTEARYVPLTHAIIVGCMEGAFPHSLPVDSLIDNNLRQNIGLPGWSELEALEDTTFHLLTCRIPNVHLTYSLSDGDSPKIRSRWIERLKQKVPFTACDTGKIESWLGSQAQSNDQLDLAEMSPEEGLTADAPTLVTTASASRLKTLIQCPYRYLLEHRGLKPVELPEDQLQLMIGQHLHKVLEVFFNPADLPGLENSLAFKNHLSLKDDFTQWAVARLESICSILVPRELRMTEAFQQMLGKGWNDVATFWGKLATGGFPINQVKTEQTIGKINPANLNFAGREISIKGSIDAVHTMNEFAVLVDYKTSSTPLRKNVNEGLEPQLPLYAEIFALGKTDAQKPLKYPLKNLAVTYFNLREGKPVFAAVGSEIKPLLQSCGLLSRSAKPDDMEDVINAVHNRWSTRLDTIDASKRFEADPSHCDYCIFDGVCRKDDPRFKKAITNQGEAHGI
jgi:hypothetical protein